MKNSRKRLYVDRKVQRDLIKRFVVHWALFVGVACLVLTFWTAFMGSNLQTPMSERLSDLTVNAVILFVTFGTLFPYFLFDTLKLTNRFAGPMVRLRRTMRAAANGERVEPIRFRDGDYWGDVVDDFNALISRYESTSAEGLQQTDHSESEKQSDEVMAAAN